ncbi:MAG: hypothetical protein ACI8R9_000635 [Paraglaciecola sp.]
MGADNAAFLPVTKDGDVAKILGFGLFPGFFIAGAVGYFAGEFTYNIRWVILDLSASTVSLWQKYPPLL